MSLMAGTNLMELSSYLVEITEVVPERTSANPEDGGDLVERSSMWRAQKGTGPLDRGQRPGDGIAVPNDLSALMAG